METATMRLDEEVSGDSTIHSGKDLGKDTDKLHVTVKGNSTQSAMTALSEASEDGLTASVSTEQLTECDQKRIAEVMASFASMPLVEIGRVDFVIAAEDQHRRPALAQKLVEHIKTERVAQLQDMSKQAEASLRRIADRLKADEAPGGARSETEVKYGDRFDVARQISNKLTEDFDQYERGWEVMDEHADRVIPAASRCVLDAVLMCEMGRGYAFLLEMSAEGGFLARADQALQAENVNNRHTIRHLDAAYDVHCGYLNAYLGVGDQP